jgi:coenzyme F420-reducing hydrogenase beta subunit
MRFNEAGELNPFEIRKGCPRSCNLCLRSCPFSKQASDEDEIARPWYGNESLIKHTGETGYYLESYVGYSNVNDHRVKGASGGLLTWTLESLLKQGMVDEVICVAPRSGGHPLFEFSACRSPEAIRSCSRSCYYPVEISKIIKTILTIDSRYAVVALPCVCKALRLAMGNLPILRKRIKYLLGLVCGQNKSRFFPEYICALAGNHEMDRAAFRMKFRTEWLRVVRESFRCVEGNQVELKDRLLTEGTDRSGRSVFHPLACDFAMTSR